MRGRIKSDAMVSRFFLAKSDSSVVAAHHRVASN